MHRLFFLCSPTRSSFIGKILVQCVTSKIEINRLKVIFIVNFFFARLDWIKLLSFVTCRELHQILMFTEHFYDPSNDGIYQFEFIKNSAQIQRKVRRSNSGKDRDDHTHYIFNCAQFFLKPHHRAKNCVHIYFGLISLSLLWNKIENNSLVRMWSPCKNVRKIPTIFFYIRYNGRFQEMMVSLNESVQLGDENVISLLATLVHDESLTDSTNIFTESKIVSVIQALQLL